MTTLDPANQLAALIRVQVASLRQREDTRKAAGRRQSASAPAAAVQSPAPDLASTVATRIRAINADDPHREQKALRMFLESVLLSELGQDLANDPSFALMLDHVQAQFDLDAELKRVGGEAARVLLDGAKGP